MDHFKSLYWICFNITCVLWGFFGPKSCGILDSWPGIEPAPPALEGEVLVTGPPGKSRPCIFVVQLLSHVWLFVTPWIATHQASLSFTVSQSLLKLKSFELMMPSNHLILCRPFSSCPQSFPASGSFPTSQLFASGGQSPGASTSASILPMNIQGWFPLGLTGLISLLFKGLSRVFSSTIVRKASILQCLAFFMVQLSHPYTTIGKTIALTRWTFVDKVISLFFNMLSRFVIAFLPRSKRLLISWLKSLNFWWISKYE